MVCQPGLPPILRCAAERNSVPAGFAVRDGRLYGETRVEFIKGERT